MAHSLIVGGTESGKTTLAKRLAAAHHAAKLGVIVLDPMNDPDWQCTFRTADPDEFMRVVTNSEGCHCFVDEAGDAIGRYDTTMQKLATRYRHFGHSCYFITQRAAMLAFTVRAQCRHGFIFNSDADDCKALVKTFNQPRIAEASALPQGHFFHVTRYSKDGKAGFIEKGQLW